YVLPLPQQTLAGASAGSAPSAPAATQAPPPELGQLILVRRDGQIVMAVAFTVRNGQLTYVTNEGTRRSFPVSELAKDTTRQMNEANGTFVSIPNCRLTVCFGSARCDGAECPPLRERYGSGM